MLNRQKIKCILIDLDDTLLTNARLLQPMFVLRAFFRLRPELGTIAFFKALGAMSQARTNTNDLMNHDRFVQAFANATGLSIEESESLFGGKLMQVLESVKRYFEPIAAGVRFVKEMSEKYPIVLATNPVFPQEITDLRISWTGLSSKDFVYITNSQNSHAFKPSTRYYEEILILLAGQGISREECLFIGNDDKNDGPAVECGITTILVRDQGKPFKMLRNESERSAALFEGSWDEICRQFT